MDSRVDPLPEWLSGWEKTELTLANDGDVTFTAYKKAVKSGDTVTLGTNGQSAYCVNYTVFAKEDTSSGTLKGDADANGNVEVLDVVMLQKWLLKAGTLTSWQNVDMDENGQINVLDLALLKRQLLDK